MSDRSSDMSARWQLLLEATTGLAADLSLDEVLRRIVQVSTQLVGARYGALGIVRDGQARRLQTFITEGLDEDEVARIGALPHGLGLLGHLIDHPESIRVPEVSDHPASCGFPPNHPTMHSFLGVPIAVGGKVFGNLYLTEKRDGAEFSDEDVEIVTALSATAAVAIENAQLHAQSGKQVRWLGATAELTSRLLQPGGENELLQTVADWARELADADVSWIVAGRRLQDVSLRAVAGLPVPEDRMDRLDLTNSLATQVIESGVPIAVEDLDSADSADNVVRFFGWSAIGPAIIVPLQTSTGTRGALAMAWTRKRIDAFEALDPELPTSFASHAALALEVSQARQDQSRLARLEDHDRIARDLHDLVIQRLFALGLTLQGVASVADPPLVQARLEAAVEELDAIILEIRRTIFALGPTHDDSDIRAAFTQLVDRAVRTLRFRPQLRFIGPVKYRVDADLAPQLVAVLTEALSNVARHAHATTCRIELDVTDGVRLTVTDDGDGLRPGATEGGMVNLRRRAEELGGECHLTSSLDRGTTLVWRVPLA